MGDVENANSNFFVKYSGRSLETTLNANSICFVKKSGWVFACNGVLHRESVCIDWLPLFSLKIVIFIEFIAVLSILLLKFCCSGDIIFLQKLQLWRYPNESIIQKTLETLD